MPPKRKLIVVIDDDVAVRKALTRQLSVAGYRCEQFASAEDFLAVAAICNAAAVLSDVHLGGLTGLQLALHPVITELNIPVILISGSQDPLIEEPARTIAAAFLCKPVAPGKLLEIIVDTAGPPISDGED